MRVGLLLAFALCIAVASAFPTIEKRDAMDAFKGRTEVRNGHAPAKDYIVIEVLKPIVHYFAAEAHVETVQTNASEEAPEA